MLDLLFNGQFLVGDDRFDQGISDLSLVLDHDDTWILVSVSRGGGGGGASAWTIDDPANPDFASTRGGITEFASGSEASVITLDQPGSVGLLVTGLNEGGVMLSETTGSGGIRSLQSVSLDGTNWTTAQQLANGLVALADANGSGFSLYSYTNETLLFSTALSDTNTTHASAIAAMAAFDDILIVGSSTEFGITSYTTHGATKAVSTFGPDSGIGIMAPTVITTVEIDGQGYALVGSSGGSAGALSVFRIGTDGSLIPTDHAMDTLLTRFGSVQDVGVQPWGDGALVVAGGGDDGLTIMALLPNGRLVHLASFEDTLTLALSGVSALSLTITGDTATIFAATQGDAGFSSMSIDLSDFGDWAVANGGLLNGTSGDDILMTNTQAATLNGGAGEDIFVITQEGSANHRIWNFNPDEDILNLSDWSFLYSVNDLDFRKVWNGVVISHGDESLTVTGVSNAPLEIADVQAAISLDVMRLPTIPNETITGSSGADNLSGDWASDTIFAAGGADTINGGAGDDTLHGGTGGDTLIGGSGNDVIFGGDGIDLAVLGDSDDFTVLSYDAALREVTLQTDDGTDTFHDVETFEIGGTLFDFEDFAPPILSFFGSAGDDVLVGGDEGITLVGFAGDDSIYGGAGDDIVKGGADQDTLIGQEGNDVILGGAGNDVIYGGAGDDTLTGGADNDFVFGGDGTDTYVASLNAGRMFILDWTSSSVTMISSIGTDIITDVELFRFDDSTVTLSDLKPDTPRPLATGTDETDIITYSSGAWEIYGYNGDDAIRSGAGADFIIAGGGDDRVWGGTGRDEIYGGAGDDRLQGEAGNDMIYGGGGADLLRGQANSDLIYGGTGHDVIYGGAGHDLLFGENGNDFISGGDLKDQIWGGDGHDDLRAGDGDDILWGGAGNDAMRGGEDDDFLYGGEGNDSILGGAGLDTIEGGAGNDTLSGGGDRDTFVFSPNHGTDLITDYNMTRDTMVLDAQLVGEAISGQDVLNMYGEQIGTMVRLSFEDGSIIKLEGVTLSDDLAASISIL